MEIDAGLWMLFVWIVGFIACGCIMTAPKMALRDLNSTTRNPTSRSH
jgi:hypothetical protein